MKGVIASRWPSWDTRCCNFHCRVRSPQLLWCEERSRGGVWNHPKLNSQLTVGINHQARDWSHLEKIPAPWRQVSFSLIHMVPEYNTVVLFQFVLFYFSSNVSISNA